MILASLAFLGKRGSMEVSEFQNSLREGGGSIAGWMVGFFLFGDLSRALSVVLDNASLV